MTDVLYITAWGRSGTTILDNILNSYPGVFSAGELFYLWRRGLVQGRRCGCGVRLPECPVWNEILQQAYGADQPVPTEVVALQAQVARIRRTPGLCRNELPEPAQRYRELMVQLYQAIGEVTGARLVVDSSKLPSGAAIVAGAEEVRPRLLHMVRDPRAVAYSWTRPKKQLDRPQAAMMDRHSPWRSSVNWVVWNWLAERVARSYPAEMRRVRYEDFIAQPQSTVEDVLSFAGVPTTDGPFEDERTVQLRHNHTVSGNPSRFRTGRVALRPDDAWRQAQPLGGRLISGAVALPLLRRYGYHLR